MKKTPSQIAEEKALQYVEKAKDVFSWNLDIAFANLMLPVVTAFKANAIKTIDVSYLTMPIWLCNKMMRLEGGRLSKTKIFNKIKKYYEHDFLKHLDDLIEALNDVLVENTPEWDTKWKMFPLLDVEFDEIPYEFDSDGKPKSYVLTLKDGYEEAEKLNCRHIKYNSKRQKVCYTWRKKQFHWFMNNITNLWW